MLERIEELERIARELEPELDVRRDTRQKVGEYSDDFIERIYDIPAYHITEDKGIGLLDSPISEDGIGIDEAIGLIRDHVDRPGLNPASHGHLGYIPGGGIYNASLGDYLADITNRYAGVFYASPGAVRMENMLIRWMGELIGWSGDFSGNLASGGSIANLIAIVTARDAQGLTSKDFHKGVIYTSTQQHHCLDKSFKIAGLADCVIRHIELDEKYRMKPEALAEAIEKDKADGLVPWLVIASAGTTDVGAIDPMNELGTIAHEHGLWFHVDAAYGGFFILCEKGPELLNGIELADSCVMDPHKGLFLPYGLGVVLVKNTEQLRLSHEFHANYMQDTMGSDDELSPATLSPELTKHYRGLRLWLPLKLHGVAPFRACLEEKLLLTKYFRNELLKDPKWEVGPEPDLSVTYFRYLPENCDANEFNEKLVKAIKADGRVFLSSTSLGDQFVIRLAVLAFRTHKHTIDLTLQIMNEKVAELTVEA